MECELFGDSLKITHHTSVIPLKKFVKIMMVVCFCASENVSFGLY